MKLFLQKWEKSIAIVAFLVVAFFAGNFAGFSKNVRPQVLGASIHVSPTPTTTPVPTVAPITIINNIIVPTSAPVPSTITPTPTPIVIIVTPTPTIVPTESPTPTSTPTPVTQTVTVHIEYAGEKSADTYTTSITSNETAWQAVQNAVGLANIHYTDYGGSLGIFITGFNGIDATSNQYYDFQINGVESSVGVSSYTVQPNDILQFVLTNN